MSLGLSLERSTRGGGRPARFLALCTASGLWSPGQSEAAEFPERAVLENRISQNRPFYEIGFHRTARSMKSDFPGRPSPPHGPPGIVRRRGLAAHCRPYPRVRGAPAAQVCPLHKRFCLHVPHGTHLVLLPPGSELPGPVLGRRAGVADQADAWRIN